MLRRSLLLACLFALVPSGVASAQDPAGTEARDQVILSGDLLVTQGQVVGDVVVFHGSVRIEGVARGVVIVLDGPVEVSGQVGGDVVATDGSVLLEPTAQVAGSVLAGEELVVRQGAQVSGSKKESVNFSLAGPLAALGTLRAPAAMGVSSLLALLVLLLMAPLGAERVAGAAKDAPLRSLAWGVFLLACVPAAAAAGAVSILALPFGLSILLSLGLLWLVGQAWVAWIVGRILAPSPRSRALALAEGWVLVAAIGLVPYLNVALWAGGSVFGIGAMTVAAWRARKGGAEVPGRHRRGRASEFAALPETPLAED
jgi:hypothetical protein